MTQAIEILERHRLFLIEVEREADVQDAIKAVAITVKQQAEEIQRLRDKNSALTQELDECGMLEKTLRVLIKRHEAALDEIWAQGDSLVFTDSVDKESGVRTFGIKQRDLFGGYSKTRAVGCDTTLAAIEAAMKEVK